MNDFMASMRKTDKTFGEFTITNIVDYSVGVEDLPKSDVLKFTFSDESTLIIRPSGTEPKLKFYLAVTGETEQKAKDKIIITHKAMLIIFFIILSTFFVFFIIAQTNKK